MRKFSILLLLPLLLLTSSCELLYLPPASWLVFPIAEVSDNSIDVPSLSKPLQGQKEALRSVSVAVLRNSSRGTWTSQVDGEVLDERPDENVLLAEFLEDEGLFREVVLIDQPGQCKQDFILSVSVDCIYNIELDGDIYLWNCFTLGLGFLIGWPDEDSSAFYLSEAVIYDNRGSSPEEVAGSIAVNMKDWYCDNIYWRPSFYAGYALEPLFEQLLYDFVTKSGWQSAGPVATNGGTDAE